MDTYTKSIEIEALPASATSRWPMLRLLVELRRFTAIAGFAAGFVAVLLFLKLSGISGLGQMEDGARAFPNPMPNATFAGGVTVEPARPVPPRGVNLWPTPIHQD